MSKIILLRRVEGEITATVLLKISSTAAFICKLEIIFYC